jgi:alkylated DNA repair dioxygenase AlkB
MNQNITDNIIKTGENILPKDGEALFFPAFFSTEESDRLFKSLLSNIVWEQYRIRFFGKMQAQPRLSAFHGDSGITYTYSGKKLFAEPWNQDLLEIKERIESVSKVKFSGVLLNLYRNGKDSIGWHSDAEKEHGANHFIGSVSFGASRTFMLRHREDKELVVKTELAHGSYLLMKGATQLNWQH